MPKKSKKANSLSRLSQPKNEHEVKPREVDVPLAPRSATEDCEIHEVEIDVSSLHKLLKDTEKENEKLKAENTFLKEENKKMKESYCHRHSFSLVNCLKNRQQEEMNMDIDHETDSSNLGACSNELQNLNHGSKQINIKPNETWDDIAVQASTSYNASSYEDQHHNWNSSHRSKPEYPSNRNEEVKDYWDVDHTNNFPKPSRTNVRDDSVNLDRCSGSKDNYNKMHGRLGKKEWHNNDPSNRTNFRKKNVENEGKYGEDWRNNSKHMNSNKRINEIKGDLFTAPKDHSLAHCVAEDLKMGSGIAVKFRQEFKNVDVLYDQRKKVGQVAILAEDQRFIYYLISKKYSEAKPRLFDLQKSLYNMKEHIVENCVKNLAIPRLGCGLDRLDWSDVHKMLEEVFEDVDINITVYNFTVESFAPPSKLSMIIKDGKRKLVDMEHQTLLILFGSESGHIDQTMLEIDKKFQILMDYKKTPKHLGEVMYLKKRNESLAILIAKKTENLSYVALRNCLKDLQKYFKKEGYYYMAFEAFKDKDDLTVIKITSLFKNAFARTESELWICWPPELEHECRQFQREESSRLA